jgi:glycosyltransferase involved in cell wall biosynthesis
MSGARSGGRRVALVTAAGELGGAEVVMTLLAARLPARGIVPVLAAPEDGALCQRWQADGFTVCPLPPFSRLRRLDHGARVVVEIARRLREAGITLVHAHGVSAAIHAGLAARRQQWPAIYHVHDLFNSHWSADGALHRLALRVPAARTIAISSAVAASLGGRVPSAQLHTIVDGVDHAVVHPASNVPGHGPLIVWCGRLQRWKGAHHFIDAARHIRKARADARFVLVGGSLFGLEPTYAATLRAQAEAAGLSDVMTMTGHVDDARPWLRAATVLVHSSDRPEPFGLVMAEAMMQERPVAAFRHGGAAEIVLDGETGRLVSPRDAAALGQAVVDIIADADRARTMGQAGRARALQYFDADLMTASVAAVYDRVPDPHE